VPSIDVTDILADTDIAGESFSVARRLETVNGYGESSTASATLSAFGSVTPTGSNQVLRDGAYVTITNAIQVITTFKLIGPEKDGGLNRYQPDVVTWHGETFVVSSVQDFTNYGAGFVQADCVSTTFVPPV
jgi:hypothetical protein